MALAALKVVTLSLLTTDDDGREIESFLIIYISGLFAITIALLLRGTYYLTMKASHVDGPV